MDIMLHLGAHRCASTTFQSFLWDNRVHLANQGLTSWTPKRTRDGMMTGLVRDPTLISIQDERNAIRSIGRIRVEIERLARAGQHGLLLSEENMIGAIRTNLADTRLYPLLRECLMRFKPAFEGRKVKIGLCIRSYEDFWTSSLSHLMARGGALPNVDLLDFLTTQPRRWRNVIRDIADVFPQAELMVWPFERMANQPAAQLSALLGHNFDLQEDAALWRNRSADLLHLNKFLALRGQRTIESGPMDAGARWMPFDEHQRSMLRAEYRQDLAWLMSGADGLARFVDGRPAPMPYETHKRNVSDGRSTRTLRPDRADQTRTDALDAVLFGGRHDGIEKGQFETGLGRTGAS